MLFPLVQLFFFLLVPWACWHLIRRRFFPTVLDNIPGPYATSWLTGSLIELLDTKGWDYHRKLAATYGGVIRVKGLFGANDLYVFDPKALNHILLKDQHIYEETEGFIEQNKIVFGEGLVTTLGEKHRRQRKMLNPLFSIAHMRELMPIFYEVSNKLRQTFVQKVQQGPQEVDILGWMARLALELIGQSGLGYSFDELTENSIPHEYGRAAQQLVPVTSQTDLMLMQRYVMWLMPKLMKIGTPGFRKFIVNHIPSKNVKKFRDIVNVLHRTSEEILDSKRKAIEEGDEALAAQIGRGKDILSVLMKANMQSSEDDKLSEEELLGQITTFTFAATDTTSTAISRTLHLLAQHKDVQNKLREEIKNARKENNGQDLGYDDLMSLPYLDAVCRESLRLHAPVSIFLREARQDVVLPLATSIKGINGEDVHEIPVPKGTQIHVSILRSNRNPELWGPDAEEWKPERWLNPLPDGLIDARVPGVYSHLLTFSAGGRSCIGFKFSQLEMKVVLGLFLEYLEFSLSEKKIFWQMGLLSTPIVGSDNLLPTLPMVISLAK